MTVETCKELAKVLDAKLADDIVCLDITELTPISDYFMIVSGKNERQLQGLKDAIEEFMHKAGIEELNVEGSQKSDWLLLDFGEIVFHLFNEDMREFYDLEHIWKDAKRIEL
ncbi:MAG: ribosome silencing factor [Lachnospiraceae bacterium]|nr:ribosome silencing factor [Lachnospiraceae bacterium]